MIEYGKRIVTYSVHNGEEHISKQEIETPVFTTKETVLKDMIDALSVLTSNEAKCVDLSIKIDSKGRWLLIKKWPVA